MKLNKNIDPGIFETDFDPKVVAAEMNITTFDSGLEVAKEPMHNSELSGSLATARELAIQPLATKEDQKLAFDQEVAIRTERIRQAIATQKANQKF